MFFPTAVGARKPGESGEPFYSYLIVKYSGMAQSRHRHKHGHHHAHSHPHPANPARRQQARGKAIRIMMVFLGILGVFVAYISAGPDLLWLVAGAIAGVVGGYFVGRSMDRATRAAAK